MRVLELTGEPILHGGQERFIANLISNLNQGDIVADVMTPYNIDNEAFCKMVRTRGGEVYGLGFEFMPGRSRREIIDPIMEHLTHHKYDIVHVHSGSISVLAYSAFAAKKAGVKKVIVHSHSTGVSTIKHKLVKLTFGGMLRKNADYFFACSREAGEAKYPNAVMNSRLTVIKNGIDIAEYSRNDAVRAQVRKELGIEETTFVIGHVGRFSEEKNHKYLIDLLRKLKPEVPECKLLLVGDGEMMQEIRQYALDMSKDVIYTGNVDDVQKYYQAMDVFLLPSIHEGLPFVLVEAQAAGLPCIMSTGVSEDAIIGENVRMIDLKEPDEWLKAVKNFRDTKPIDNTEAIVRAGYDIGSTVSTILDIYRS